VHESPIMFVCRVGIDISRSFGLRSLLLKYLGIQLIAVIIPLSFWDYHDLIFLCGVIFGNNYV
jgi:hypothetical protein